MWRDNREWRANRIIFSLFEYQEDQFGHSALRFGNCKQFWKMTVSKLPRWLSPKSERILSLKEEPAELTKIGRRARFPLHLEIRYPFNRWQLCLKWNRSVRAG